MTNDQDPKPETDAEHQKTILVFRMVRIVESLGVFVKKDGL
jgi:hypothetical protein